MMQRIAKYHWFDPPGQGSKNVPVHITSHLWCDNPISKGEVIIQMGALLLGGLGIWLGSLGRAWIPYCFCVECIWVWIPFLLALLLAVQIISAQDCSHSLSSELPLIFPLLETNKCCKHCGSNSASNSCSINSAASRSSRKWCKIPGLVPAISCFWTLATSPSTRPRPSHFLLLNFSYLSFCRISCVGLLDVMDSYV